MRTRLLFPPTADPAHPPLGIAALSGYLAANGEEVSLLDLNIRAWNELLSAEYLRQCAETLRRRISAFNRRRKLMPSDCRAYSAIIARSKLANYPTEARIGFNAAATPWAIRCIPASFG